MFTTPERFHVALYVLHRLKPELELRRINQPPPVALNRSSAGRGMEFSPTRPSNSSTPPLLRVVLDDFTPWSPYSTVIGQDNASLASMLDLSAPHLDGIPICGDTKNGKRCLLLFHAVDGLAPTLQSIAAEGPEPRNRSRTNPIWFSLQQCMDSSLDTRNKLN